MFATKCKIRPVSRINQNCETHEHYNSLIKSKWNYLQKIINSKWNYLQKIFKGPASLSLVQIEMFAHHP